MCRIFAFRSRVGLTVQRSLLRAENALRQQSHEHPHGWGVAWYVPGEVEPRRVRSVEAAWEDSAFTETADLVAAPTVLAHIRKATVGGRTESNTHPFRFGRWVFCHNGTLQGFREIEHRLVRHLAPKYRRAIEGATDSEVLFLLVLQRLELAGLDVDGSPGPLPEGTVATLSALLHELAEMCDRAAVPPASTAMNFVLTDGRTMVANRWAGPLFFSTEKERCADAETCPIADKVCFGPRKDGQRRTHVLIASERTGTEDRWEELPDRALLLVDSDLRLRVEVLPT